MNIHIEDKDIFNDYWDSTIFSMKMGSVLYKLNDKDSDTDFISIIAPPENHIYSFNKSIHQIQYKDIENKVDYVFTDVFSFFWNLLNGDSTINFEILHSDDFKKSEFGRRFSFLTPELRTYNIIIAYLGFANRDIKYFFNEKTKRGRIKKLIHIERGLSFAKKIFYDYENFSLIDNYLISLKENLNNINENDLTESYFSDKIKNLTSEIKNFRQDVINKALEKKELTRFLSLNYQKKLDETLANLKKDPYFAKKQMCSINSEHYYLVNENGLKY